jgi:primosomal protein N'
MIAEVYPLLRLPRSKRAFDYLVGEGHVVQRGSMVRIPYRHRELWGIVRQVKDKPPRGITLKTICCVDKRIRLREGELSFFETMAQDLAQSVSSVLNAALAKPPKRPNSRKAPEPSCVPVTLPRSEAEHVVRIVSTLGVRGKAFVQTPDLRRATAVILGYIQQNPDQKILVLAPTVRDVTLMHRHLMGHYPLIITGNQTNNERFAAWEAFRSDPHGLLLGTRTALLSIDASITTIFLVRSGDVNHKQEDRNPRYDARVMVWQHQRMFSSNVFCMDVAPGPATPSLFEDMECLSWGVCPSVQIVKIHQERQASELQSTSYSSCLAVEECLAAGKQVLCVYNKKGSTGDQRCRDCGHLFLCPTCQTSLSIFSHTLECARCRHKEPLALRCPNCRSANLGSMSLGNLDVARELQRRFPQASISIIDKEHPKLQRAEILLVTTFFYEAHVDPFKKTNIGLVLHLSADAPLYNAAPTAVEALMRDLWQWAWVGFGARARVLFQTTSPDLVRLAIDDPFGLAKEELQARARYQLPPLYRWSRVVYSGEDELRKSQIAMQQLFQRIADLPESIVHPVQWNEQGDGVLACGVPQSHVQKLLDIFSSLPDRYIIDTNILT